jgi:hypothetical protein
VNDDAAGEITDRDDDGASAAVDDVVRAALDQHVDQLIHPLLASSGRKSRMREELTAHLLDAFAQELQRAADAEAARDATLRRFGDRDALTQDLQASVPALERLVFLILKSVRHMWRLLVGLGVLVMLFGTSMILPALAMLKRQGVAHGNAEPMMRLVVGIIIGVAILMAGVHLLGWGIARKVWKTAS